MIGSSFGHRCESRCNRCGSPIKSDANGRPIPHETPRGLPCRERAKPPKAKLCPHCGLYVCACEGNP
jgi:hypothetical protein